MAKGKINMPQCSTCGEESEIGYCYQCHKGCEMIRRDKRQVLGDFTVVDWFSSRSSAGLIVEDTKGSRYALYMSDVFSFLSGLKFGNTTLEETKKGSAYGWRVVPGEVRNPDES